MCGPTQIFWPDRFNRLDVYRSQTNRHPPKHSISIDAMLKFFIDHYCAFFFFYLKHAHLYIVQKPEVQDIVVNQAHHSIYLQQKQ